MPRPLPAPLARCLSAVLAVFLAPAPTAVAQLATRPTTTAPAPGPVVELSPFTVNTTQDVGYLAENTLAGSRLNTKLRDTAGSVSVFTKEFLDDLALTDLASILVLNCID